ncbi:hypothetical protein Ancab_016740 [Ancistrocladus abbreviatus]
MTEIEFYYSSTFFTDDDYEVADIFVELEYLFLKSEPPYKLPSDWGCKKRRSAIDPPALPPHPATTTTTAMGSTTSPSTPLSFSPSEPDCKSQPSKRKLTKRSMEELQKLFYELTQERATLMEEFENISLRLDALKAEKSKLESLKRKLGVHHTNAEKADEEGENEARLEACERVNLAKGAGLFNEVFGQTQPTMGLDKLRNPLLDSHTRQLPYPPYQAAGVVINRTAGIEAEFHCRDRGPLGLPDLNVSIEESCSAMEMEGMQQQPPPPLDVNTAASREGKAAMARHNRHRRKELNKMKCHVSDD